MTTVLDKPPIPSDSPSNSPQTNRRRKVNRSNHVARSSPARLRRARVEIARDLSDVSSEEENVINENLTEGAEGRTTLSSAESASTKSDLETATMARPTSLILMDTNQMTFTEELSVDEKKASYLTRRRNTEKITTFPYTEGCTCRSHRGGLGSCDYCKNSKRRHTVTPTASKKEVMKNEAKLLVLEFLSSLPAEKLTARLKSSPESGAESMEDYELTPSALPTEIQQEIKSRKKPETGSIDSLKNPRQGSKKGFKANTVTIGAHEREELMRQLREHEKQYKANGKLNRSASDASQQSYSHMRTKLNKMKLPVQKWLLTTVNHEIKTFDKNSLNPGVPSPRRTSPRKLSPRKPPSPVTISPTKRSLPLSLTIPRRSIQQIARSESVMYTPETFAVNRLEEISEDIMKHYPELLNEAIDKMLDPIMNQESLTYDIFSKIARTVYNIKVKHLSTTVWSRVALVLYMVKETMILGNLNDKQLELLVEHSTNFMTENVNETVEKEGGWDAIELDDWMFYSNVLARDDEFNSSDDDIAEGGTPIHKKYSKVERNASFRENIKETLYEWSPYGMAALAVGLGLAYSYLRI